MQDLWDAEHPPEVEGITEDYPIEEVEKENGC
jgi:hypothetical protein